MSIMAKKRPLYNQTSLYFPKHERNFFMVVDEFVKQEYPDKSMSWFILMCIKHFVNAHLNVNQKKRFKKLCYEITGQDIPEPPAIIEKLQKRKDGKSNQTTDS